MPPVLCQIGIVASAFGCDISLGVYPGRMPRLVLLFFLTIPDMLLATAARARAIIARAATAISFFAIFALAVTALG
jgi:hypothetical protein